MNRSNRLFTGPGVLSRALLLTLVLLFATSCRGELDPERPEDAYLMFRDALFAGDADALWNRTDEETRAFFDEHYTRLVEMNRLIERYLPQTDHQLARAQSGVEILAEIDSGESLFLGVFSPQDLPDDQAITFGSTVREIRVSEEGDTAVILTRGGQEFFMTRQENEWFVNLVRSEDFLVSAFDWIQRNESALEQTVEDLIAQEQRVREGIIAELMGIEDQ